MKPLDDSTPTTLIGALGALIGTIWALLTVWKSRESRITALEARDKERDDEMRERDKERESEMSEMRGDLSMERELRHQLIQQLTLTNQSMGVALQENTKLQTMMRSLPIPSEKKEDSTNG